MKQFNPFIVGFAFLILMFSSCQKELYFPEQKPLSTFTVVMDGQTYNLEVNTQTFVLNDTAILNITGASSDITVRLESKSVKHKNGVGDYDLICCNNDVFIKTSGPQIHFEGHRFGVGNQKGHIKITRLDEKGYSGSYSLTGQAGTTNADPIKEFTGSFNVIF